MNQLITSDIKMTSLDIAEVTGKMHKHVMADVRKEITDLGDEIGRTIFRPTERIDSQNRKQPIYEFGKDGAMQLALKYDAKTRYNVIKYVEQLENDTKPKSQLEIMQMQINQMVQQEKEIKSIKTEQETIKHRLDNMDNLDTIGDLQQRLVGMVNRYAQDKGISFGQAWRNFRASFNIAYRTNLKLLINNYKEKHNLKSLTMPQYLSLVDRLPDAIRVADKMLNKELG